MDLTRAREVSQALLARPQQALDVLAREELGLNPDDLGSPWRAASVSFVAFAAGAALPLIPFLAGLAGARAIATVAGSRSPPCSLSAWDCRCSPAAMRCAARCVWC